MAYIRRIQSIIEKLDEWSFIYTKCYKLIYTGVSEIASYLL